MNQVAIPRSLDRAEALIVANGGEVQALGEVLPDFPVVHRFTPGLYSRTIFMPAGAILTSKMHRTEHPFVVSQGAAWVYSDNDGPQHIAAPYHGITKPWTRRLLVIERDMIWTTFHVTEETDVKEIERTIIEPNQNPLLPEHLVACLNGGGT